MLLRDSLLCFFSGKHPSPRSGGRGRFNDEAHAAGGLKLFWPTSERSLFQQYVGGSFFFTRGLVGARKGRKRPAGTPGDNSRATLRTPLGLSIFRRWLHRVILSNLSCSRVSLGRYRCNGRSGNPSVRNIMMLNLCIGLEKYAQHNN